jgi:NADH-quinone oxidoreductase subunit H
MTIFKNFTALFNYINSFFPIKLGLLIFFSGFCLSFLPVLIPLNIQTFFLNCYSIFLILLITSFKNGLLNDLFEFFLTFLPIFISVIYFTHAERKVQAAIQRRRGPNVISFWGLLQPIADGVKLLFKETIVPSQTSFFLFFLAPVLTFGLSLINWAVLPMSFNGAVADSEFSLLIIYAVSSFGVYGIFLAGWASNSRYSFFGAIRAIIQLISYEIAMGFVYVILAINFRTLRLSDIVISQENYWNIIPFFPLALIYLITMLAETNRAPFDLPESEGELVAGYNLEYTSFVFSLFFLGEYSNMLSMSAIISLLFFGGWLPLFSITSTFSIFWLSIKIIFFAYLYILIRSVFPRFRYDQLMYLCWNIFLPYLLIELSLTIFLV